MATPSNQYGAGATAPVRESPVKVGLIFGVVIAVVSLILNFLWRALNLESFGSLFNLVSLLVMFGVTGNTAARRLANPALSGLIAGVVSTLLNFLIGLAGVGGQVGAGLGQLQRQSGLSEGEARAALGAAAIFALLFALGFFGALGALFGWIGGKLARRDRATAY